jgi:hypothetical protein
MMIFKKALPRRTFLRGLGATLALPLLDGMVPAFASTMDAAARPAARLGFVYIPMGIIMNQWTPKTEGAAFEMTPILEPLVPFRERILVLSGLAANAGLALEGEGAGDHARASAAFMSGAHPKKTEGSGIHAGISIDQYAAKELGKQTQLASLELGIDSNEVVGTCDSGYSCAYNNTLCWRTPTTPVPMENKPRAVFERLFGDSDSTDPAERLARIRTDRSILDFVTQEVRSLATGLGANDRAKLTDYLDAIRDVERRIHMAEEQSSRELPSFERPVGVPDNFTDQVKLMMDLLVLAYQCDLTRVFTFMMGQEGNTRVFKEIGISDAYHPLTHHQNDAAKIAKVIQIDLLNIKMFAYLLDKLQSTPDGDGTLLDHSMIVYGSGLSDGNLHTHDELPVVLAGGGAGQVKGGRHLRFAQDTPITNLYVTMMDRLGIAVDRFGDSTGRLSL